MNSEMINVAVVATNAKRLATKPAAASSPRATTKRIKAAIAGTKVTMDNSKVSISVTSSGKAHPSDKHHNSDHHGEGIGEDIP